MQQYVKYGNMFDLSAESIFDQGKKLNNLPYQFRLNTNESRYKLSINTTCWKIINLY